MKVARFGVIASAVALVTICQGGPAASHAAEAPAAAPAPAPQPGPSAAKDGLRPQSRLEWLLELRQALPSQLEAVKAGGEQVKQVWQLFDACEAVLKRSPASEADYDRDAREFLARGGELRDLLEDLRVPDPGDVLPPGPHSRLGVIFSPEAKTGRAVVNRVLPQYRGDKMGIRVGDVLLTLNGAALLASDLVQTLVGAKRPYVIEVRRQSATVTLTEPKSN
jgi:hypothetical protein